MKIDIVIDDLNMGIRSSELRIFAVPDKARIEDLLPLFKAQGLGECSGFAVTDLEVIKRTGAADYYLKSGELNDGRTYKLLCGKDFDATLEAFRSLPHEITPANPIQKAFYKISEAFSR